MKKYLLIVLGILFACSNFVNAQADWEDDDEDYSMYDDFESVDGETIKTFAPPSIVGMSPQKFVTIGWDAQLPYNMELSPIGEYEPGSEAPVSETADIRYTGGFRFSSNIPIISKSKFIWQSGINFMDVRYRVRNINKVLPEPPNENSNITNTLNKRGLRNLNWTNTFYVPINEKSFFILQAQIDMSGDFGFKFQPLRTLRYSAAALFGQRPHERLQWAVGVSRTYRVGNMNYIPIAMFNWTSKNRKWGTEILLPARAHGRYTFNKNNILLFGLELEGQSYRIGNLSNGNDSFEIRRGEIRPRIDFQKKLFGNFWGGLQVGYRINYSFDADNLENGRDFYRGFFGDQSFAMLNNIGNAMYFNFSISFVSP